MVNGEKNYFDPRVLAGISNLYLRARWVVEGMMSGVHRSRSKGFSVEFEEHREYSPGDEIRRIDWKALGKFDRYFIKEYEDETNLRAYLAARRQRLYGLCLRRHHEIRLRLHLDRVPRLFDSQAAGCGRAGHFLQPHRILYPAESQARLSDPNSPCPGESRARGRNQRRQDSRRHRGPDQTPWLGDSSIRPTR